MSPTTLQGWIAVLGGLLTAVLGIFNYFHYRTRRDRVAAVGQAFSTTVDGLSSDAAAKKLAAAILLRRFFDKETEQGTGGAPYEREAIAVIAALLRNTETTELQKLLADGLAYASSLREADLQECNLSRAYLGRRARAAVTQGAVRHRDSGPLGGRGTKKNRQSGAEVQSPEGVNLSGADLFHANLTGTSLRGACARHAVFYMAIANRTVFEGAQLEGADFRGADLTGARFNGAWLEGARFGGATNIPPEVQKLLDDQGGVPIGEGMPVELP